MKKKQYVTTEDLSISENVTVKVVKSTIQNLLTKADTKK